MAGSPPNLHTIDSRSACIQGMLKVKVKDKGHVIRALSWILGMSYSVIDGLLCWRNKCRKFLYTVTMLFNNLITKKQKIIWCETWVLSLSINSCRDIAKGLDVVIWFWVIQRSARSGLWKNAENWRQRHLQMLITTARMIRDSRTRKRVPKRYQRCSCCCLVIVVIRFSIP